VIDELIKCMLASMGIACYVTVDSNDYQLSGQQITQTDRGVLIVGTVNVPSPSIATRFFCTYNNDAIIDVPLAHQISGLSYVSISISLSTNYNKPISIAPIDSCVTVNDCEITVDTTAAVKCRVLLITPNGATISSDSPLSLVYVDGIELTERIYVGPGVHILEFTSPFSAGSVFESMYQIYVGGYALKVRHRYFTQFII
jgi:hypothetical protein